MNFNQNEKIQENETNQKFYREYRGQVIDNHDPLKLGRVKVFIPDIMSEDDKEDALWVLPGNQINGGANSDTENQLFNSQLIPQINSYWIIKFEEGNPENGYYIRPLQLYKTLLQPEFQIGKNYENKMGVKTKSGNIFVISDDDEIDVNDDDISDEAKMTESDQRTEITGKKKNLKEPFKIIDNQKTILIDERKGKEKILIEDNNGNSIMISTQKDSIFINSNKDIIIQNYDNDISIMQNKGNLNFLQSDNINMYAGNDISLFSKDGNIKYNQKNGIIENNSKKYNIKSEEDISLQSNDLNLKNKIFSINSDDIKISLNNDLNLKSKNIEIDNDFDYNITSTNINEKQKVNFSQEGSTTNIIASGLLNFKGSSTNLTFSNVNISGNLSIPIVQVGLVSPSGPVTGSISGMASLSTQSLSQQIINYNSSQTSPNSQNPSLQNVNDIEINDFVFEYPTISPLGIMGDDQDRNYPRINNISGNEKIDIIQNINDINTDLPLNYKNKTGKSINEPKSTFKYEDIIKNNIIENLKDVIENDSYKSEIRNQYNS